MGWRDKYSVHPVADRFPMLPEDELAKLQADIEGHGVRVPIGLYDEIDAEGRIVNTWLIDGRNRLEAAERAGMDLKTIPIANVSCSDPVTWIIGLNIRRRHLTKQQQADIIVEAHKAAEAEELKRDAVHYVERREAVSRQDGEKFKPGRKPDKTKAHAIASAKEVGISPRTVERSFAKAAGKKPQSGPKRRRSSHEINRDQFMDRLVPMIEAVGIASDAVSDVAGLLSLKQRAAAVATVENGITRLKALLDRLRLR